MRFPFALTAKIAKYIVGNKLRGNQKFATVLQLEPLHTCNLTCTGCGRIREYSTSLKDVMPLEDCLGAASECNAPMVSICGGEPLIYPQIEALSTTLLNDQERVVYLCTNAMFMRRKMRAYLAREFGRTPASVEPLIVKLTAEGLMSEKEAGEVRKGPKDPDAPVMAPHPFFFWNVHLDGLEYIHDLIVEREGVFKEAVLGMRMAKILGYQVCTNTTVYKETDMQEVEDLLDFLGEFGVDGHTISPGYEYDSAKADMVKRLNLRPEDFFLTREGTREKFKHMPQWSKRYSLLGTPIYHEFLAGHRELECSAWAIPTRNIAGWRGPCYFMAGAGHFKSYQDMLTQVDWTKFGVEVHSGKAKDPRCENCMTQCGFEPSGALSSRLDDTWKNFVYNFAPKPKANGRGKTVNAYNGVTAGKGHITGPQVKKNSSPLADSDVLPEPVASIPTAV